MIWGLIILLVILWLLGFVAFHIGGAFIHILIVLAVLALIWELVTSRRSA